MSEYLDDSMVTIVMDSLMGPIEGKDKDQQLSLYWTAEQHKEAFKRIDEIFDAEPGTPKGFELNWLVDAVVLYEDKHYPIGV